VTSGELQEAWRDVFWWWVMAATTALVLGGFYFKSVFI
jgi:hypothetical protein